MPPSEFSFDTHAWYRVVLFLGCLFCISGFLAGIVGGHPWPYSICFSIALPAIFTPLFWLLGCRSIHRSYVISAECVIVRRRGQDLDRIALTDIADVRLWPLAITLHSGRKISFHLARSEMLRARESLLHVLPKTRDA